MRFKLLLTALLLAGCGQTIVFDPDDLDAGNKPDHSTLASEIVPSPTEAQKNTPVVITAHGFGASTYETSMAAAEMRQRGWLVSEVLLGGHGASLTAFSTTTWKDWQAPVLAEYRALVAKGYRQIGLLGTSTGGTLILEGIATGDFQPVPRRIALVAPILDVADGSKQLGYADILGWLGQKTRDVVRTGERKGRWYRNAPLAQLRSLLDVMEIAKADLRTGISLPADARLLLIQSTQDTTVDPKSAEILRQGIRGITPEIHYVNSTSHVPIWPNGALESTAQADLDLRDALVKEIADRLAP